MGAGACSPRSLAAGALLRAHPRLTLAAASFAAACATALFTFPAQASAVDLFPLDDAAGKLLEGIGGAAGEVVGKGFQFIVQSLFGGDPAELTTELLRWLVDIPNLSAGNVGEMERTTSVIAFALLGAVLTSSVVRYYVAGLSASGSGGFEAIEGLTRTALAACLIAIWPTIFDTTVQLADAVSHALLGSEALEDNVAAILASGVTIGGLSSWSGVPLFIGIAIAIAGMILLLALVAMKIIVTALTVVIYLGMPLALVLWPLPELSWLAGICMRALVGALAIPLVWALVFGAFAALWSDTLLAENNGEDVGLAGSLANIAIVKPMVAIALMYLAITLPKKLVSIAPLMGGGGGVARFQAMQAIQPHVPAWAGGARGAGAQRFSGAGAQTGSQASSGASGTASTGQAAGGAAAVGGAAGMAASAGLGAARSVTPTPGAAMTGGSQLSGTAGQSAGSQGKAQRGAYSRDQYGGPRQAMTAERAQQVREATRRMREIPTSQRPSAQAVGQAYASLPPDLQQATARAIWEAPSSESTQVALAGWAEHHASREYRDALTTIGSGSDEAWRSGVAQPGGGDVPSGAPIGAPANDGTSAAGRSSEAELATQRPKPSTGSADVAPRRVEPRSQA